MAEDFEVTYNATKLDDDTVVVTSALDEEEIRSREKEILTSALQKYNQGNPAIYSVTTNDSKGKDELTLETIDNLAIGINSSLQNQETANRIILRHINEDGLMGYAYSCVCSNCPTEYSITYKDLKPEKKTNQKKLEKVKARIEQFNKSVRIERIIRDAVARTFLEGNTPMIYRWLPGSDVIDLHPLSIFYPSGYTSNGDDIMEADISVLKTRLSKTYKRNKQKKAIYFENLANEVKKNFSAEVYKAFVNGDTYCRMDTDSADCVKINAACRPFGVSPFFRALRPLIVLNNIEAADVSDSKARSKKIILQLLRKELLGPGGNKPSLSEQQLAHDNLTSALRTNLCAYTAPAFVEDVRFVTSKANNEDSVKQQVQYTTKYLQSLGIAFVDTDIGSYKTADISITQLIRTINQILEEIERVINKFYWKALKESNLADTFEPSIHIARAETMELAMKIDLSKYIYGTLGASLRTAYRMIGLDLEDEVETRRVEKENGVEDIMTPHPLAYTASSGETGAGRPASDDTDPDKQAYDQDNNK